MTSMTRLGGILATRITVTRSKTVVNDACVKLEIAVPRDRADSFPTPSHLSHTAVVGSPLVGSEVESSWIALMI
jgi:hypothetical protein